ncbi:MAG: sulfatase-like hydrolase/transferase [Gemmatimonadetes bacterium]|jgi:arylsulfatase A-like enzyme|nr:sulfatase-like hydrolase/transferase [Gemmatimonadota bacterium]MBT5142964.1 sulfatase-like hydrolase/transferase [Gemmatimonadota bacterium]MBT5959900.1 sulfatase-like hydrolase/transferase [Gemmatimonadota bacterium]MBT6627382.1 sulfatase-like hydrolase/transferase [Gemmatimonadota bacterium]MBT7455219.1 sulfatase-like hydrolase/transferase [Gemmatimonadota bacterium]
MPDQAEPAKPDQPNILYILADDLGWGDVGFHGAPIRTPILDRLATDSVELTQHYVCPMCTPTRASLLTGRHPSRFGAHATVPSNAPVLPDGYVTLATTLRLAGYETGLFGKWHLGSAPQFGPNHFGFDRAYGSLAGGVDPYNHFYKRGEHSVTWHSDGTLMEEQGHVTDLIARQAVEWIESRKGPWFCYVPFTAVHVPIKPTQDSVAQYDGVHFDDDPARDASFRKYAAYTSHMDAAIGQLLEALERTCERENTIVVFTSDNGGINDLPLHGTDKYPGWQEAYARLGSNLPYRGVKAQLYEGGVRVPTLVNWRSHLAPGVVDAPLQVVDWMPTFIQLAGATLEHDPQWDGRDVWAQIEGVGASLEESPDDRTLFWNFRGDRNLGVRHGDWKLIDREIEGERVNELFDIVRDPHEEQDLVNDEVERVRDLSEAIEQMRRLDDSSKRADV